MPVEIIVALIAAFPPTLISLIGLFVSLRNSAKLGVVATHTNGLLARAETDARAQGVTQGHAEAAANIAANR